MLLLISLTYLMLIKKTYKLCILLKIATFNEQVIQRHRSYKTFSFLQFLNKNEKNLKDNGKTRKICVKLYIK